MRACARAPGAGRPAFRTVDRRTPPARGARGTEKEEEINEALPPLIKAGKNPGVQLLFEPVLDTTPPAKKKSKRANS